MRNKQRRLPVDKLFVLGAGASYSATRSSAKNRAAEKQAPLDKDFTRIIAELNVERPIWVNNSVQLVRRAWRDPNDFTSLGLEEAILTHAANMDFVGAIRRRGGRNSPAFAR